MSWFDKSEANPAEEAMSAKVEKGAEMLPSIEAAVEKINSGDSVYIGGNSSAIGEALINPLLARVMQLEKVTVNQLLGDKASARLADPELQGHVRVQSPFLSGHFRKAAAEGRIDVIPMHLREVAIAMEKGALRSKIAIVQVAPADEKGNFNLSVCTGLDWGAVQGAETVIAVENPAMPRVGGEDAILPKELVDYVVKLSEPIPLPEHAQSKKKGDPGLKPEEMEELEKLEKIGKSITNIIIAYGKQHKGEPICLQAGIGGPPDAVLGELAESKELRELVESGEIILHLDSEMISTNGIRLIKEGLVKKATIGFILGTLDDYKFAAEHPDLITFMRQSEVNNPVRISQNHQIALNTIMMIDTQGQVLAHNMGGEDKSGVGGSADFLRGAQLGDGIGIFGFLGASKKGAPKIAAELPRHSQITQSTFDIGWLVTEEGAVNLKDPAYLTKNARAEGIISLAPEKDRQKLREDSIAAGIIREYKKPEELSKAA